MNFEWSTNEVTSLIVSIYETNLTLNRAACQHFEDVNHVLLGIDREAHCIGIKPVSHEEIAQEIYPASQLYKISIGKSYGRITSKPFVEKLKTLLSLDFHQTTCFKYLASYDVIHGILIIDYEKGEYKL